MNEPKIIPELEGEYTLWTFRIGGQTVVTRARSEQEAVKFLDWQFRNGYRRGSLINYSDLELGLNYSKHHKLGWRRRPPAWLKKWVKKNVKQLEAA